MRPLHTLVIALCAIPSFALQAMPWEYQNNRIAISADGNNADDFKDKWPRADPDDWGATPATMAIIAKAGLSDEVVHFSYNNFIEANVSADCENVMDIGVQSGIKRFGFDPSRYFDVTKKLAAAKSSLKAELARSTASDPLYFIHMGPSEFFYQCVKECVDEGHGAALAHVYVISHSGYNDNHLRRPYHHTMEQAIAYSNNLIQYKRIKDQNSSWSATEGWNSLKDFTVWQWMLESEDPNIQWLYERLQQHSGGVADISDAGLLYFLITGDEAGNPAKLRAFLGDEIVPNSIVHPQKITTDCRDLLVFVGENNKITAQLEPELTSNQTVIWSSSHPNIAMVENGVVCGVAKGRATITAKTADGGLTSKVKVVVKKRDSKPREEMILSSVTDFTTLEADGFVPAYIDKGNKVVAVNAAKYKDKYAATTAKFRGKDGLYDLTLVTLKELDGESRYRVYVDNRLVGEFQNPTTEVDYEKNEFALPKVTLRRGDVIRIESNTDSNFKIPEGDIFAYSRGRWSELRIQTAR